MNTWIQESIKLANSASYLDKLFEIYPVNPNADRLISEPVKQQIQKAFAVDNRAEIIKGLLKLKKFPINHPYVSSLRKHNFLIDINPRTIKRIGDILVSLGYENTIELATAPKAGSKQLGHTFKNWLEKLGYPFLKQENFLNNDKASFLQGNDNTLKIFAKKELKITNLKKGVDFILKAKNNYFIGEAKFLTDNGGTQNNQFRDGLNVGKINKTNIQGVAVLDGILWFPGNQYMNRAIKKFKGTAISALLLKKFISAQIDK